MASNPQVVHHSDLEVVDPHLETKYQQGFANADGQSHHEPGGKTIWGLQATVFWLLMALVFVVLAAGIGGGVGGTLAVNNAKTDCRKANLNNSSSCSSGETAATVITATVTATVTQNSTSTATPTSGTIISVPTSGYLPLDCPVIDNTNLRVTLDTVSLFLRTCGQDISGPDIAAIITYSDTDCAKACASYNRNLRSIGCKAVVFSRDLTSTNLRANFGNCFMKNSTSSKTVNDDGMAVGMILQ